MSKEQMNKPFEELTLKDDFMFGVVMRKSEYCKPCLERILKRSFVIFICTFDYFGEGRHIYTFENRCQENPQLAFGDETVKIILNTKGTQEDASQELLDFLKYIENGIPTDEYTQELEKEVNRVRRNEKWRLDYMTLYLREQESYMDGKEDGLAEGIEKGMEKGMEKKSLEIAKELLDVLDVPTVAKKTGLSEAVVQELKDNR